MMADAEKITELRDALAATRTFMRFIARELDLDSDETVITINAVGKNGQHEIAQVSLRSVLEQADAAIANAEAA